VSFRPFRAYCQIIPEHRALPYAIAFALSGLN